MKRTTAENGTRKKSRRTCLSRLPPGASGTDFRVLDAVTGGEVVRSRAYDLELELLPLLRRELRVQRLRLEWLVLGEAGGSRFALPSVAV